MPRDKPYDYKQSKLVVIDYESQLQPGTVEHALRHLVDKKLDLSMFDASFHNEETGRPGYDPAILLKIVLNQDALVVLERRWGRHDVYVFTYQGAPVARTSTKAWYAALKRAGISRFRWHDLRHTWASWHVQSGTRLQELQELGGWSSYEMVLRYAHLSADHLRMAADRILGTNVAQPEESEHLEIVASD